MGYILYIFLPLLASQLLVFYCFVCLPFFFCMACMGIEVSYAANAHNNLVMRDQRLQQTASNKTLFVRCCYENRDLATTATNTANKRGKKKTTSSIYIVMSLKSNIKFAKICLEEFMAILYDKRDYLNGH